MTRPFGVFQPRDSLTGGVGVCSRVIVTSCCSQMSSHLLLKTLGLSFSPAAPGRGSSLGQSTVDSDHLPLRYKLGRAASPNEPQRDFSSTSAFVSHHGLNIQPSERSTDGLVALAFVLSVSFGSPPIHTIAHAPFLSVSLSLSVRY